LHIIITDTALLQVLLDPSLPVCACRKIFWEAPLKVSSSIALSVVDALHIHWQAGRYRIFSFNRFKGCSRFKCCVMILAYLPSLSILLQLVSWEYYNQIFQTIFSSVSAATNNFMF